MMLNPAIGEVSILLAFMAGIVSFLSPCVLPLIPGYVSMVSNVSFDELQTGSTADVKLKKVLFPSLMFVLGFTIVFVLLGMSASFAGSFLTSHKNLFLQISGGLILLFGLFVMELIKIPQLYRERRMNLPGKNLGMAGTVLLGVAFGFGWTPCVGPILSSILAFVATTEDTGRGALLLSTYSLGLGLPFILTGLALSRALSAFSWVKRHYTMYKYVVGGVLVLVGTLMLTNNLFYLNIYGQRALDLVGIDFWQRF